tara:strand:+ start:167 stop:907 length:741 start_codon:yes stop_codon:yes gene_type:complete
MTNKNLFDAVEDEETEIPSAPAGGSIQTVLQAAISEMKDEFPNAIPLEITSLISGETVELIGSISDIQMNWGLNWNEEQVYGRIDAIPTYSNTQRTVSFTLNLLSPEIGSSDSLLQSKANMLILQKIANMCYPGYQQETGGFNYAVLKSAPLIQVKMGNILCNPDRGPLTAYMRSFNYTLQNTGLYKLSGMVEGDEQQQEKIAFYNRISVSFDFGILHDFDVGFDGEGNEFESAKKYPFGLGDEDV